MVNESETNREHPRFTIGKSDEVYLRESLESVVGKLCSDTGAPNSVFRGPSWAKPPSRPVIVEIVEALQSVLFPGYFGTAELTRESQHFHIGSTLDRVLRLLEDQVYRGLCFFCDSREPAHCSSCETKAGTVARVFLARLPIVQALLATDALAAYEGDPAASSPEEAVFCYPGMLAITSYRIAHELHRLGVPLIPRIMTEHAHSISGVDIHPGAKIGEKFFIDHGTGVVIGETTEIGERVRIYQGVTLGAKSFPLDKDGNPIKGVPRHPIVESDVVIYAGATILGRVRIGKGSVIGGNVWLTRDVLPGSRISQAQLRSETYNNGGGI